MIGRSPTGDTGGSGQSSQVWGVSVRGWIAVALTLTICLNQVMVTGAVVADAFIHRDFSRLGSLTMIGEPLYSMGVAALGFYFGQKTLKQ